MRSAELDALIAQGVDAMKAAKGLSGEEQQIVARAIARSTEVQAEEPTDVEAGDSEPEPKAEAEEPAAVVTPRRSARKKG